jgi:AcrR family transcriptional regulator
MTSPLTTEPAPARRLQPAKRRSIEAAGLRVFAREGYSGARIESIAEEASVSTRTLYKHFAGKRQLFATVLEQSAARVAQRFAEIVDSGVTGSDATHDVTVLARALAAHHIEFPEHFALVRQLIAEADHLPSGAFEAWQAAGPLAVNAIMVRELRRMRDAGQISLTDVDLAARHLAALVSARALTDPRAREQLASDAELRAAVAVFLHGYAARDGCAEQTRAMQPR